MLVDLDQGVEVAGSFVGVCTDLENAVNKDSSRFKNSISIGVVSVAGLGAGGGHVCTTRNSGCCGKLPAHPVASTLKIASSGAVFFIECIEHLLLFLKRPGLLGAAQLKRIDDLAVLCSHVADQRIAGAGKFGREAADLPLLIPARSGGRSAHRDDNGCAQPHTTPFAANARRYSVCRPAA